MNWINILQNKNAFINLNMRKKIVAGNWKMNLNFQEAEELIESVIDLYGDQDIENPLMIICPPHPFLELGTDLTDEYKIAIGAQNVSHQAVGAYTGEVAASMLKSMDVEYCIVGHSERRKYFKESAALIKEKIERLLENEIHPIFCCGELLEDREQSKEFEVVKSQIEESILHLTDDEIQFLVIAYEPVWAIGTGLTATPEQAEEMHAFIRKLLTDKYGSSIAEKVSILYGGSCNPQNARELFSKPNVDGGLIGGASLKASDFYAIYKSF